MLLQSRLPLELAAIYQGDTEPVHDEPNPPGHVILVDSTIGYERVITQIRKWRSLSPPAQVIVLELSDDADTIVEYIEAGANGYALKGSSIAEVADLICGVQQGAAQCSPEIAGLLFKRLSHLSANQVRIPNIPLTRRELEILQYIAKGFSNKEIAHDLVIEVRTVKHHVHNILNKLEVQHRWDAARLATYQGWLDIH